MSNDVVQSLLVPSCQAGSPDGELIRLSRDLFERASRLHRCDAGLLEMDDATYEEEQDAIHAGGEVLMQLQPVTMAGLLAKAKMVRVQFERLVACDYLDTVESSGETHERLAWSVLNDLLEMMGGLDGMPTFNRGISARTPPARKPSLSGI